MAITVMIPVSAIADADHHADQPDDGSLMSPEAVNGQAGMAGMTGMGSNMMDMTMMGDHHKMMQMMVQMHFAMDVSAMEGSMPKARQGQFPMMGAGMMDTFDADGDGEISNEEAHGTLQSMHGQADTDANGQLNLQEFEIMHTNAMRETMVDRFQALDADGDGAITEGEMTAPADMMGTGRRGSAQSFGD
ncbi:EF-hand domain-containing protein [Octadecabacter sp. R77987]|uniref:EF-hand domain-containing protein n=1 Tax=Octadecabacter sp. R77987 TaxID=3093874 RepID=UPI00366FAF16